MRERGQWRKESSRVRKREKEKRDTSERKKRKEGRKEKGRGGRKKKPLRYIDIFGGGKARGREGIEEESVV